VTFTNDTMHFVGTSVYFIDNSRGSNLVKIVFFLFSDLGEMEIVMASSGSGIAESSEL